MNTITGNTTNMNTNTNTNTNAMDKTEELLAPVQNRFVLFPIRYNAIWQMYKKAESAFWTAEEVDLSKDMSDWERLNDNERHFVEHVLAFFAGSDGIVNENLAARFMNDIQIPEARAFYGFQIAMENIHCVTGDTEILTKEGYMTIRHLAGKVAEVWNGEEYSRVMVSKTSDSAPVSVVALSNGMKLTCTSEHKWAIDGVDGWVFTKDLESGMQLKPWVYPSDADATDPEIFSNAYKHGSMVANTDSTVVYNPCDFNCRGSEFIPQNFSRKTKMEWLRGVLSNATKSPYNQLILKHNDYQFLKHLQLFLTSVGVHDSIFSEADANVGELQHRLFVPDWILDQDDANVPESSKIAKGIHVLSVTPLAKPEATYCFEEPKRHMGIFNGILTGQSEMYSVLIDTYIKDSANRNKLFNAIDTIPAIKKKAEWAIRWIQDKDSSFATRLVAFACVEGIFFSGAFCSIFWLKERGLMPGLCVSNELISRDESLHTEFAALLYSMLSNKLSRETIYEIVRDAVMIEDEFINESIPCNMLGMNAELMSQYIKFVADRLVVQLGYPKIWNVTNPFPFMDRIGIEHKDSFFEVRVSNYAKANVGVTDVHKFSLEEDF